MVIRPHYYSLSAELKLETKGNIELTSIKMPQTSNAEIIVLSNSYPTLWHIEVIIWTVEVDMASFLFCNVTAIFFKYLFQGTMSV